MQNLKKYYKIVNLRNGCFVTPIMGGIINQTIANKIKNLEFDNKLFLQESKKHSLNPKDLSIIYPTMLLLSKQ